MGTIKEKAAKDAFANMLGIQVDNVGEGTATCSVVVTEQMINFLGVAHGGLIFSLADVAFAAAGNSTHSPSLALDVSGSFLRAAHVGDVLRAEAEMIHTTKRTGVYRMQVFRNDELLATFSGTVFRK